MLAANCLEALPEGLTASVKAICLGQAAAAPGVLAAADGVVKAMAWAKVQLAAAVLAASAAAAGGGALAVAKLKPAPRPGPNQALKNMPENSWLKLDPPREPLSRTFSGCCFGGGRLWYFGGGHYSWKGNDVELYDPRVNRWTRATEPEWPREGTAAWKSLTSLSDGTSELSPSGRPYTEHTFQQVCWDPGARKFVAVLRCSGTWEFDPESASWTRLVATAPDGGRLPYPSIGTTLTVYDPSVGAPVAILSVKKSGEVFVLERAPEGSRWRRLGETPAELRGAKLYATYVPEWNRHLVSCIRKTGGGWFRLKTDPPEATALEAPGGPEPAHALAYDAIGRAVVVMEPREVADRTFAVTPWALDVASLRWTELDPGGPAPTGGTTGVWAPLWFDPDHDVFLFLNNVGHGRRHQGGPTETWAYRHKKIR
jgi:hypothetical protein